MSADDISAKGLSADEHSVDEHSVEPGKSVLAAQRSAGADGPLTLIQRSDGSSLLWKTSSGPTRWVKWHPSSRKLRQEAGALRVSLPVRAPRLLAVERVPDDPGGALVMTHVDGREVDSAMPPEVWEAAGAWLRELHDLSVDASDPMPLATAIRHRKERLLTALSDTLTNSLSRRLADVVEPSLFEGEERALCHRDFMPRNWLWNGESVGVIDFEHARLDHPYVDLVKLEAEVWPDHPALRSAFFKGYGSEPARDLLLALLALHGGTTLEWGLYHGREDFVALGRSILES